MYEIHEMPEQISSGSLDMLRQAETATIGHFHFLGFADAAIRTITPAVGPAVGTAVTLVLPALDSTLLHHAVGMLRPGDILVVDRQGDRRYACLGGGIAQAIKVIDATAVIVDGPCADPQELRDIGLPIWARGYSAITTRLYDIWGAMNIPVVCGGAVVTPGDAVLADENGVLFLRPHETAAVAERAITMQAEEQQAWPLMTRESPIGRLSGATKLVEARLREADD